MARKRGREHLRRRNGCKPHVSKQCLPKAKREGQPYGGARKRLRDRTCAQPCTLGSESGPVGLVDVLWLLLECQQLFFPIKPKRDVLVTPESTVKT